MHLQVTNNLLQTQDVYSFSFEPVDALGFTNEYSGLAVSRKTQKTHLCILGVW
jgi:hypothetical protein